MTNVIGRNGSFLHQPPQCLHQLADVQGLAQVGVHAGLAGAEDVLVKGVGGQGHNGQSVRIRAVEGVDGLGSLSV